MAYPVTKGLQTPVGIDLGTTFSVVASLDESGRPVVIPNEFGETLTPSSVLFRDGEVTVGRNAVQQSAVDPAGYADCFKRDIGGRSYRHKIHGVDVPPEVLSGLVLRYLKSYADQRLGVVEKAVITVPAFFDEMRRQSTFETARLAGLGVLDIINEPTAAAVAYAYESGICERDRGFTRPENLLVYDLGGGTFDATVLHVDGWTMRALATDGDVRLGGRDCDERLVGFVADRFLDEHGLDPRVDPSQCARLWTEAERAKHILSTHPQASVPVHFAGLHVRIDITCGDFENLVADLVGRTETTLRQVVQAASLEWHEVNRILLVGGATRMPMVSEMILRLSGKRPEVTLSPDEAVARGAAIYAGMLLKTGSSSAFDRLQLVNVNSHSLGIVGRDLKTKRRVNTILIPRNTPLPARKRKRFPLAKKNQRCVVIPIVEGEARHPDDCVHLGNCVIDDLPTDLLAGTQVVVEYSLDASGLITVAAEIPGARRGARVQITRDNARTFESLDAWCKTLRAKTCDAAATAAPGSPPATHESMLKELDEQYIQLGQTAMWNAVPQNVAADKQAAVGCFREMEVAKKNLAVAEKRQSQAASRAERIQASSDVARCKARLRELEQQYRFFLLGLGRGVVQNRIVLPESNAIVRNIERIERLFSSRRS
ncbi:MAG: Hsp70 family protein [Pirellulaceae bacterium]